MAMLDKSEEVLNSLRDVVVIADDTLLREIATFDNHGSGGVTYQEACELHYRGLRDLIHHHGLRMDFEKHSWYPMEAIELRAFVPEAGNPVSFGIAIAILLFDDLINGRHEYMEARSGQKTLKVINDLPTELSDPILAGLSILRVRVRSATP